jgi:hypothetical protein
MENQNVDSQFDSQFSLLSLTLVYTSEHSSLLPGAYFHVALEQVAGDDEMLDIIIQSGSCATLRTYTSKPVRQATVILMVPILDAHAVNLCETLVYLVQSKAKASRKYARAASNGWLRTSSSVASSLL